MSGFPPTLPLSYAAANPPERTTTTTATTNPPADQADIDNYSEDSEIDPALIASRPRKQATNTAQQQKQAPALHRAEGEERGMHCMGFFSLCG